MLNGMVHPDFADVAQALRRQLPKRGNGGAAVTIYHRGERVAHLWGGTRDAAGNPWEESTLSTSFSTTKGVASTLIHILADRGLVDYDAPVREYWPEFAQAGKENVTLRQVMCHEAGLFRIGDLIEDASEMTDWDHMARTLAAAAPCHTPGEAHGYHALTYGWLVGEIARRVTGKPFRELIATEIAHPLGLDGLYCGLPEDKLSSRAELLFGGDGEKDLQKLSSRLERLDRLLQRMGTRFQMGDLIAALSPPGMESLDFNDDAFNAASIPAANGAFNSDSLARLYAALAGGGELDGVRLLSQQTLARATEVQSHSKGRVIPIAMGWRLGYHRVLTIRQRAPKGFGHYGFGGSGAWADPERNLSFALVLNSGVGTPFGDSRIVRLSGVALRCADRR
jgi:CubicO group peptidase (beta-lactamase class C family)